MSFKPKSKDDRVLIVDFNHIAHIYMNSQKRFSYNVQGVTVDTTVANGAIKNIFNWSKGGRIPTVVCFDRPCPSRKAYYRLAFPEGVDGEYKGKRESASDMLFDGMQQAKDLLEQAGVSCLYQDNWEADDLVFLAIQCAKEQYPNHYIDVVTNDADMLPLVDERVSIFLRSRIDTYAEFSDIKKNKYVQVTPQNFQKVVERLSSFKGKYITVPYNTILLWKVLRGDVADGIVRPYPPRTMTPMRVFRMVNQMVEDGVDITNLFRYTLNDRNYFNKEGQEITKEQALSIGKSGGASVKYYDNPLVDKMVSTLIEYGLSEWEAEVFRKQYRGMNLAQVYDMPGLPERAIRKPLRVNSIKTFSSVTLGKVVSALGINLSQKWM